MILDLAYFIILFFLCGQIFSRIFSFCNFTFFENIIFGMFYCYLHITILSVFTLTYDVIFFFLIILSLFFLGYLLISNFYVYSEKIIIQFEKFRFKISKLLFILFGFTIFLIAISTIYIENILNILSDPLSAGDALAVWFRKAKYFIHNPGLNDFPYTHYPNFISSLWSIALYNNYENFNYSRFILPLILFLNVILVYLKIMKNFKNFLINTFLLNFILIFYSTSTFGGNFRYSNAGYADFALSAFLMTGFVYILLSFKEKIFDKKCYLFGCFALAILPSIKNEGIVISFGVLFILNLVYFINFNELFKKNIKTIFYSIIVFLLIAFFPLTFSIFAKMVLGLNVESVNQTYFSFNNLTNFELIKDRFTLINKYFYLSLLENKIIFFLLFFLIFINLFFSNEFYLQLQILILISLFCIIYIYSIYFLTKLPLQWHLVTSMNRIFYPFTGIITGLIFLLSNFKKNKTHK